MFTKGNAQVEVVASLNSDSDLVGQEPQPLKTPQRRARYSDKQRIRLKEAKKWAFQRTGCKSTPDIKKYLKILARKLDLRLTSAWLAIVKELAIAINNLRTKQSVSFKVSDRVGFVEYVLNQASAEYITIALAPPNYFSRVKQPKKRSPISS